jgi:hypothetical protein
MKAAEHSQEVDNLIAILTRKLDMQDDSPLCTLVACHIAQVVSDAQTRDCPDVETLKQVEDALDKALKVWQQYESLRSSRSG